MLCLSRREGEVLVLDTVDGLVRIVIREIRNGQVRLGVDAPAAVLISREAKMPETEGVKYDFGGES